MKRSTRYYLLSLGCAKNTVDAEGMAQLLGQAGYTGVDDPARAHVLIVNTCGFIDAAREESLQHLRELAAGKKRRQLLIAAGCLAQFWGPRLAEQVPGLDGIIGTRRWMDIVDFVERVGSRPKPGPLYHLPDEARTVGADEKGVTCAAVNGASAYLKVADGCRRRCAFCSIRLIKGAAVSRPPQVIAAEARMLVERGVRELILIAQDLTDYGHDLGIRDGLPTLIESILGAAPELHWLRLMYTYPGAVSERLIEVMATHPQAVHYLDMPLQHAHPAVLRRMRRPASLEWIHKMLDKLRTAMPDVAVRTTFIVGYPGETEDEFQALLDFVREVQFDRLGAFSYSFEPGTPSAGLADHVPEEIKQERYERLMEAQQAISLRKNQALVGQTLEVLIEGCGDGLAVGRSYRDAPEIDGLVLLGDESLPPGQFVPAVITGAAAYDLYGQIESK
ncbi:MAG: 30S ribosomal protein S12 methylthiotransferase RimO [Thermoflexales bacterium]|nr:30S ribosomal protein S12 methylthiotransferase RimO [Thermoflexales bacterium]